MDDVGVRDDPRSIAAKHPNHHRWSRPGAERTVRAGPLHNLRGARPVLARLRRAARFRCPPDPRRRARGARLLL